MNCFVFNAGQLVKLACSASGGSLSCFAKKVTKEGDSGEALERCVYRSRILLQLPISPHRRPPPRPPPVTLARLVTTRWSFFNCSINRNLAVSFRNPGKYRDFLCMSDFLAERNLKIVRMEKKNQNFLFTDAILSGILYEENSVME